jgi:hypothetical protein
MAECDPTVSKGGEELMTSAVASNTQAVIVASKHLASTVWNG